MFQTPVNGGPHDPPATGGHGLARSTSSRSDSRDELDECPGLLRRDFLTVDRLGMQLGHPNDLVFVAAAHLEAAGAAQASELSHPESPLVPV